MDKTIDKYERRRLKLLEIRDREFDGSNSALGKKIGKDASYVARMLYPPGKEGKKRIGEDTVEVIDREFGWAKGTFDSDRSNVIYLPANAGGTGGGQFPDVVVSGGAEATTQPSTAAIEEYSASDTLEVPRFNAKPTMGAGGLMPDREVVVDFVRVTRSWVRDSLPNVTSPANLALLAAYGDSMDDTFGDGDLLWVDAGVRDVKIDAIYVLALRDELYVKRLQRRPDGSILMISDNKKYEPYVIQNGEREKFEVLGRVIFAWRGKRL